MALETLAAGGAGALAHPAEPHGGVDPVLARVAAGMLLVEAALPREALSPDWPAHAWRQVCARACKLALWLLWFKVKCPGGCMLTWSVKQGELPHGQMGVHALSMGTNAPGLTLSSSEVRLLVPHCAPVKDFFVK